MNASAKRDESAKRDRWALGRERPTIALRARIQLPPSLPFVRRPRRLRIWGMEFNVKKCKVLRVVCTKCIYEKDYFFLEELIKLERRVAVEKDLGILISHDLSWNHHVDIFSSRAQRMLNLLYED